MALIYSGLSATQFLSGSIPLIFAEILWSISFVTSYGFMHQSFLALAHEASYLGLATDVIFLYPEWSNPYSPW